MERKKVVILGTLDTKEVEAFYLKDRIQMEGCDALIVDVSAMPSHPTLGKPDITQEEVAQATGSTMEKVSKMERGAASKIMSRGATNIVKKLCNEGKIHGAIGYGGSFGVTVVSPALTALPIGFPKYLITTGVAAVTKFIETKDIVLSPSITDLAGGKAVNQIEAKILANAAAAVAGMSKTKPPEIVKRPSVLATQMGITTPCTLKCKELLEKKGYEMVAFHAIGTGGRTVEALVEAGYAAGVLDITLSEISDELLGGVVSAGPKRLTTAGRKGIPQVIVPGGLEMVCFNGPGTKNVPIKFKDRLFYFHNPMVTLMRINKVESRELGKIVASKVNKAMGPTAVIIPLKGWSTYDMEGGVKTVDFFGKPTGIPWYNSEANAAFVEALEMHLDLLKANIDLIKVDKHINDPEFAELLVNMVDAMIKSKWKSLYS